MSAPGAALRKALTRGGELQKEGRLREAAETYAAILKDEPDNADAWHLLGTIEIERGFYDQALALIGRALAIRPGRASYHHNRAYVLGALGRVAEAEAAYREAVRLKPDYAEAYFNLAGGRKFEPGDPLIADMEELLAGPGLSEADRCFLEFALGKAWDDVGEPALAFGHFAAGNAAKAAQWDEAASLETLEAIAATFDRPFLESRAGQGAQGADSELPILVVGMPRSGTSLVEQVLASHPKVHGAGELPDLDAVAKAFSDHAEVKGLGFPACMPQVGPAPLKGLGEAYIRRLQEAAPEAARVVDKAPLNFRYLGLVAVMLPEARIVHCRRDPLDTCLSCYFQNFAKGQAYSFDLAWLGAFYRGYHRLMEHWRAVLPPGRFLEVDYESLVAEPEPGIRRLLDFCKLEWDPACLASHETRRPVATASRWQVRQPIYRTSVKKWRAYAPFLGPLADALGDVLPAEDRAFIEEASKT